jgi:serine/threonine protein kinase
VKVLHTALAQDAELLRRFLNEARAASAIRHPNIIDVLDAGETPRDMYFGHGDQVATDIGAECPGARDARMKSNRALSFEACRPAIQELPNASDLSALSSVLRIHDERSAMS